MSISGYTWDYIGNEEECLSPVISSLSLAIYLFIKFESGGGCGLGCCVRQDLQLCTDMFVHSPPSPRILRLYLHGSGAPRIGEGENEQAQT